MKIFFTTISILTFFLGLTFDAISNTVKQRTDTTVSKVIETEFNGTWVNENNQRRMFTKCTILYIENSYVVQMWGDCQPEDCDWGNRKLAQVQNGATKFQIFWK